MLKNYCCRLYLFRWGLAASLSRDELEQIPFRYRLLVRILLKFPNPCLPFFILRRFPEFEGIMWAVVAPILLTLYFFFNIWLFPLLAILVGFPLNVIFGFIVPAVIFLFFLRIQIERTILWWRNIHKQSKEWEPSKRVEELIELIERQHRRKK